MSVALKETVIIIAVFLWIGFVSAISFMEAWLKFRAPGVNLSLGLGIGRVVFNALNKVECFFAIFLVAGFLSIGRFQITPEKFWIIAPVLILTLQTLWMLPALDQRAKMHLKGQNVPRSSLHFYYVAFEVIKVISLFIFGINQFK